MGSDLFRVVNRRDQDRLGLDNLGRPLKPQKGVWVLNPNTKTWVFVTTERPSTDNQFKVKVIKEMK